MNKIICTLLTAILVSIASVNAQNIKLSGTITDRQGTAINNATIMVKDSVGSIMTTEHSDSTGYFVIKVIPNKSFTFNVSSLGYADYSHKFQGGNKELPLTLCWIQLLPI